MKRGFFTEVVVPLSAALTGLGLFWLLKPWLERVLIIP